MRKKSKGLTLIELLILGVILLIIILVTVVPLSLRSCHRSQYREREMVMQVNLVEIRNCLENYKAEHGKYLACPPTPDKVPGKKAVVWAGGKEWKEIEFSPADDFVYHQYEVSIGIFGSYTIRATGDMDGDVEYAIWEVTEKNATPTRRGDEY